MPASLFFTPQIHNIVLLFSGNTESIHQKLVKEPLHCSNNIQCVCSSHTSHKTVNSLAQINLA